jgi:hypothetical protein
MAKPELHERRVTRLTSRNVTRSRRSPAVISGARCNNPDTAGDSDKDWTTRRDARTAPSAR